MIMFSFQYKSFPSSSFTNEPSNTPSWRGGRVCACLLILLNPSCCCGKSLLKWDNNYLPECREKKEFNFKMLIYRTSLVVQWVGIHLLVQGTQVLSLFQGDATRHAATKPLCHNY